ncbi:DUF1653 domain-containing protein [Synechocystis sp. FACHB-383]|uniref:DUF1653 domain-containing protein n=1 Tax=Synechocystis sp. FACHB-383 TaxID=2692864 RepID=UPI0016823BC1|nr:DUF1653 domain-containing protein [Synechocystis sp. FACHB-383]MBD2653139.1 DUF1653 domain-containing protein [Synechocystis sp. FACHB-383]
MINEIYRHKKSSGFYRIVGFGLIEATKTHSVIYESLEDGQVWVRPTTEFFDGRFEFVHLLDALTDAYDPISNEQEL